jgi:hypothetical protein
MEKILLEEINRVREIMGLKLISEAVGPKPRTVGGILLNALIDGAGKLKPQNVAKKMESQLSASGNKEAKSTAGLIKSLADDVKKGISKSQDFETALVKYLKPEELNFLVRNIGRNSTEVLDNYITATVMLDDKIYKKFVDMVGEGEKFADERIKDYIARTALDNPNFYDIPTLERMWTDIESGQFRYADEAGISVPGRKTKPEEPGFKVDAEGIKDTDELKIGDDIPKEKAEIILGDSDDQVLKSGEELAGTEITKYLDSDLRFRGASVEAKNRIIEQVQKTIREKFPNEFKKFEDIGKSVEDIAEAAWKQKVKPSDKQAIIEKSFEELRISFEFNLNNLWTAFVRDITLKDPTTGVYIWNSRNSIAKKFKNYLIMNLVVLGIESFIDWIDYQDENPDEWGDSTWERFYTFYNPAKIARVFLPLPSVYTAIVSKLAGTNFFVPNRRPPAKDELFEDGTLKKYFNAEGDIITKPASTSPDMNGNTENDDFAVYVSDNQGKNYGLWTYNTEKNNVEIYKNPVENAASLQPSDTSKKYENKLDSFKQFLKDNNKKDYGAKGPGSNGVYQNGSIDYEFVDPTKVFKTTEKNYED